MTEDEAKTKACPMAATFGGSQQLADGPGPHCIGPACMAWRTARIGRVREGDEYQTFTTEGFCGLSGSPQ